MNGTCSRPFCACQLVRRKIETVFRWLMGESRSRTVKGNENLLGAKVFHLAGAYPGFRAIKGLGVFLLSPRWDVSPSQGYSHH